MNSIKLWKTAPGITVSPSCFAMPMSGHAFGAGTTSAVRERVADIAGIKPSIKGAVTADRVLVPSYFPGNSAWRPPTC